jgi:hypothetical protein
MVLGVEVEIGGRKRKIAEKALMAKKLETGQGRQFITPPIFLYFSLLRLWTPHASNATLLPWISVLEPSIRPNGRTKKGTACCAPTKRLRED